MKPQLTTVLCAALFVSGCVTAPRETVELAEIVDRQIVEMQVSHEKFVRLYYDKLRDEVDRFLEDKWIPQFLANVVEGTGEQSKKFRSDLDNAYKLATVDWEETIGIEGIEDEDIKSAIRGAIEQLTSRENATLGMVLLDFSAAVQEQINERRRSLIEPIDQQEAYVLDQLRASYADLQRGTATIKGYLASAVKLVEQRDAVLDKIGALEKQREIIDTAVKLNDGAVHALTGVEEAAKGIAAFAASMDETMKELESIGD